MKKTRKDRTDPVAALAHWIHDHARAWIAPERDAEVTVARMVGAGMALGSLVALLAVVLKLLS